MIEIFKSTNTGLMRIEHLEEGVWINMVNPSDSEINSIINDLNVEADFIRAALDEEERARIDFENGQTLVIVDIPVIEREAKTNIYTTIPLGIVILKDYIVTVCLKGDTLLDDFVNSPIRNFFTQFKTRFILQILHKNSTRYLQYLRHIDKMSNRIEQDLHKSTKNKELIQLLKLEKSLVYFSTSLKSNELVLEKIMKYDHIKKYPDDTELLEDVIIENKQAIEMANIYSSILSGTMDAFASVISNNVNFVMKFLTSVTIVMAIPTMVSSFFGMNVPIPFGLDNNPFAFGIVLLITIAITAVTTLILARRRMF